VIISSGEILTMPCAFVPIIASYATKGLAKIMLITYFYFFIGFDQLNKGLRVFF